MALITFRLVQGGAEAFRVSASRASGPHSRGVDVIGHIDVRRDMRAGLQIATVDYISVQPIWRGQGVGTGLYEAAAAEAEDRWYLPLASDTSRSAAANAFWIKQFEKGLASEHQDRWGETFYVVAPEAREWDDDGGAIFDLSGAF